jgi:hypothetical protein
MIFEVRFDRLTQTNMKKKSDRRTTNIYHVCAMKIGRQELAFKRRTRRSLPLEQRDIYVFNALDMIKLRTIVGALELQNGRAGKLSKKLRDRIKARMRLLMSAATEVARINNPKAK